MNCVDACQDRISEFLEGDSPSRSATSQPAYGVNTLTCVFTGNVDGLRLFGDQPLGDPRKYKVSYKTSGSPAVVHFNAVTCVQNRRYRNFSDLADRQGDQVPGPPVVDPAIPGSTAPCRAKHRRRQETAIQKALEQWGLELLTSKQTEDADIAQVKV